MCDILLQQWFLMKYFISYIVFGHLHLIIYTENKQKRITWILIKESIIPHNLSVEKSLLKTNLRDAKENTASYIKNKTLIINPLPSNRGFHSNCAAFSLQCCKRSVMIYPAESVFVFVFSFVFFSLCFGFIQWKPFFSRQHNNMSYKMLSLQRPQLAASW